MCLLQSQMYFEILGEIQVFYNSIIFVIEEALRYFLNSITLGLMGHFPVGGNRFKEEKVRE